MESVLLALDRLARSEGRSESEMIARALRAGVKQLERERTLGRYLRGEIDREEAVRRVGGLWVDWAEQQRDAVEADVRWALGDR